MRGWLEIPDRNSLPARWFGKEYDVPYFESPWEIEAYELELVMWDIFNERNS
jgi:hypothetical protein